MRSAPERIAYSVLFCIRKSQCMLIVILHNVPAGNNSHKVASVINNRHKILVKCFLQKLFHGFCNMYGGVAVCAENVPECTLFLVLNLYLTDLPVLAFDNIP